MPYKNYIIIAHDNPEQLKHLVCSLDDSYAYFYIHIDKKRDKSIFIDTVKSPSVTWVEDRISAPWGSFGLTQAIINSLRQIVADDRLLHTILLSN